MIYTTGTIAGSGNTLTGTGTNFTAAGSLIRVGCTLIAFTSPLQVLQITGITSGTALAVTPAINPAIPAGTRYAILLSDSLSVDGLAQDIAETFGMYQRTMSGFADVMNGSGDVTITINGTQVTVPGQKSLAKKGANSDITSLSGLTTPLSLAQGGLGVKTAYEARAVLQVPSANTGSGSANLYLGTPCFFSANADGPLGDSVNFGITLCYSNTPTLYGQQIAGRSKTVSFRYVENGSRSAWFEFYTAANTTKASDGTLKAASPVARIVKSKEECTRPDVDETGFAWCGCGTANAEAEGINISRLDVGVYVLTGSAGLASEGWRLLPPRDPDGAGDLGIVEAEETESGGITVRLYKRRYVLSEEGDIELAKGVLIDIPVNSWIDIRLDMPADSTWKQKQEEAQKAMEDEEQRNQENQQAAQPQ